MRPAHNSHAKIVVALISTARHSRLIKQRNTKGKRQMQMLKNPAEYAAQILDLVMGNKMDAIRVLFEAEKQFKLPRVYVADTFNVITGN